MKNMKFLYKFIWNSSDLLLGYSSNLESEKCVTKTLLFPLLLSLGQNRYKDRTSDTCRKTELISGNIILWVKQRRTIIKFDKNIFLW